MKRPKPTEDASPKLHHSKKRKGNLKLKAKKKRLLEEKSKEEDSTLNEVPLFRKSDDPLPKRVKWINKQRVLIFSSRGITFRDRHLMTDLKTLTPNCKSENKIEKRDNLQVINEIAEMKNCNKCLYFESKKHQDLYMWAVNIEKGPSIKFQVQNVHSMLELKLTGNCLKGSRPLLCFDTNFKEQPWALMKELLMQILSAPRGHPKTQPFFDRVYVFSLVDARIWFRNYQIVEEDGQLTEIGPRFILNPIKIFEGSFGGRTLWSNKEYITPNKNRALRREAGAAKYLNKLYQKKMRAARTLDVPLGGDPTDEFFVTKPPEEAEGFEKNIFPVKKSKTKRK